MFAPDGSDLCFASVGSGDVLPVGKDSSESEYKLKLPKQQCKYAMHSRSTEMQIFQFIQICGISINLKTEMVKEDTSMISHQSQ